MMKEKQIIRKNGSECFVYQLDTVVVGSGAAGLQAALRLHGYGQSVAIVTEGMKMGTSRNTGSDKQTYYKISLCGNTPDSPRKMAEDLFSGGCVDGDIAYAEAASSAQCFLRLCELGVPFPTNRLGEYVGYQTDHDTTMRATSAGPLTSKMMTQCLENAVMEAKIPVFDRLMAVQILKTQDRACGLLAFKIGKEIKKAEFVCFYCKNIVWATGGPAGIYADTVYPFGHSGANGVAFLAGVTGRNLTEWQYGLASVSPRWNVSGTYMQVLPRMISVGADGDEEEFLLSHFESIHSALSTLFQKGYEWPFDCKKAHNGSSVIDLLVYREKVLRKRRVYLDFRTNPAGLKELPYQALSKQARTYLENAGACFGTPIERLCHMNMPAYELYCSKGVDLKKELLEISLCAQHNNGGLAMDSHWQTNIRNFYACGECAGSHGIYRPGGSALNAGQVGALRAAQHIAHQKTEFFDEVLFFILAERVLEEHQKLCSDLLSGRMDAGSLYSSQRRKMSRFAGVIRSVEQMQDLREEDERILRNFSKIVRVSSPAGLQLAYRLRDTLAAQIQYLAAMEDYAKTVGASRGSAIFHDPKGVCPKGMEERFRFSLTDGRYHGMIQETTRNGKVSCRWRTVHPLEEGGGVFETVWREYREGIIFE